ncbi:MAG TPA: sulfatase-like hydrolase/transferase [Candidatus Limnocylindria bacterium]|nr:sulfatase-like hydrolase/transferase [Candidatus Limnocylindria bacterium]
MLRAGVGVAIAILTLAGCGGRPAPPYDNVVVVVIDALRADHLGCYGYARPTSPAIDALAERGTRFEQAVTPSPWTLPAMATLWTGLLPAVHGAVQASDMHAWVRGEGFQPTAVLDVSRTTLAEVLSEHGLATAGFVAGSYPSAVFGMGQGFDTFVDRGLFGPRMQVEALWAWLESAAPARFFAYLHIMSVHSPYEAPSADPRAIPAGERGAAVRALLAEERRRWAALAFDPEYAGTLDGSWATLQQIRRSERLPAPRDLAHLVALYDQGIRYTDHWVGELVAGLEARGLARSTFVVLTADHGEELGEHGGLEHTRTFYDEVMRVPLVVVAPGMAPRVVTTQVGLLDVFPTVLDLLGITPPVPVQGLSLRPALEGQALPERDMLGEASQVSGLAALRTARHKYVVGSHGEELYDLRADPAERHNLCAAERAPCIPFRERLAAARARSAAFRARHPLPAPDAAVIDDDTRRRLRALGYH